MKTMTQMYEYNHEENSCSYTKPCLDLHYAQKNWGKLTAGMSEEELSDFTDAKETLENYEKIYSIVEYVSEMHEGMTTLEKKIQTNNPTMP
jgi:hypothetical protein